MGALKKGIFIYVCLFFGHMKHVFKVTLFLVVLFLLTQIIGLIITSRYVDVGQTIETGELSWKALPSIGGVDIDRPDIEPGKSFLYIIGAIIIGTLLILLLIRWKKLNLWKLWFFVAVVLCLHVAFSAFISPNYSIFLALILGIIKVYRPNVFIHNFTELFIYSGLAVIFVPVMNLFAAFALMILLSIYDMYAVWKSKHMINMAKFQTKSGVFAGMLMPYKTTLPKKGKKRAKKVGIRTAILGGGDIGFPLIFAGVVFKSVGLAKAMIIPPFAAAALLLLLLLGKKNKFYPAMPFISAGCFVGYLVVLLTSLF
jgi:presenilin-like A22 family membrane protease